MALISSFTSLKAIFMSIRTLNGGGWSDDKRVLEMSARMISD